MIFLMISLTKRVFFIKITSTLYYLEKKYLEKYIMGVIGTVLLVCFVIVCLFLVLLVSIQDDGENGMGGLMGGRGTAAFGSHSASVLTKTTMVFVILFFALTVGLALVNKTPKVKGDLVPVTETQTETETTSESSTDWWSSTESNSETVTE